MSYSFKFDGVSGLIHKKLTDLLSGYSCDQCIVKQCGPSTMQVFLNDSRKADPSGHSSFFETGEVSDTAYDLYYAFEIDLDDTDGTVFSDSNYMLSERGTAELCHFIKQHYVVRVESAMDRYHPSSEPELVEEGPAAGVKRSRHS